MTTKTALNNTEAQETFPLQESIIALAREMVKKRPGIYYGNLEFWIKDKLPEATKIDVKLAVLRLMYDEDYFMSLEYSVYPPNKVDVNVKMLTRFVAKQGLSFTDYGILYELYKTKEGFKELSYFSRMVVSQCWSEDEKEVKTGIGKLLFKNILTEKDGTLAVNWGLIQEATQ